MNDELDMLEIDGDFYLKMTNHYIKLNDIITRYYTFKDGEMVPLIDVN